MKWRIGLIAALVSLISLMACNLPATRSSDPVALASVVETTVCRAGPAERFDPVRTFEPGQQVEAVGRSAESDYWLVRAPDDLATLCWLPAGGVTLAGDPGLLPVSTPPVTPTLAATSVEGPTPVIGCPTPVGGGPTPVSCDPGDYAPPAGSGCPTPVGGGPTPVSCDPGDYAPPAGSGCPTPVGGGPTPVSCDPGDYAPPAGSGCPTPYGGGPTPVSCPTSAP